jgi:hypothetical protein
MTFAEKFIEELTAPIIRGDTKGTFTKSEFVANWDKVWARCWNYNLGLTTKRRLPETYPDKAPVFRAILKSEFMRVSGFTPGIGWTDDWTLSRKLRYESTATNALCYHVNPASLSECFTQARWIGKNEFISGNFLRRVVSIIHYSLPFTLLKGIFIAVTMRLPAYLLFKIVYDAGIYMSIAESFARPQRNK